MSPSTGVRVKQLFVRRIDFPIGFNVVDKSCQIGDDQTPNSVGKILTM